MTKIVLTGGPCAGKSTALADIRTHFTEKGYHVITVAETATELIESGVTPFNCASRLDFQRAQMTVQYAKEQSIVRAAESMAYERILIVFDRGAFDTLAYVPEVPFLAWHAEHGISPDDRMAFYDGIFHLTTAAKGALHAYTTANNTARKETPEEAAALDDRILRAWEKHPRRFVIDNDGKSFSDKLAHLLRTIESILPDTQTAH